MRAKNITVTHGDEPAVAMVTITVHLENPIVISLYKEPSMNFVGLYNVVAHTPGPDAQCQHRPEGTCIPHDMTPTSYMVLWRQAQTELEIEPRTLLFSLLRKIGVDVDDIPKDWLHELQAAITWITHKYTPLERSTK